MFDRFWQRKAAVVLLFAALTPMAPAAVAQQIDPRVLQQLGGAAGTQVTPSQRLDAARERDVVSPESPQLLTAEEQEVRRQQSRTKLQALYVPSAIEKEFRSRTGATELRLFGYDLFRSTEGSGGALTGAVSGNYIIGVGDELIVSFQGATNNSVTARVDREGRLIVGQLSPIRAAGRSLAEVSSELSAATRRTLLGTDVSLSVGSVRNITVLVGGEVERPGQYQITALSDLTTVLAKAGGIRQGGTLRNVRILRANGGAMTVDLYGLLGIGIPPRVGLQDGDRVIVPVIGDTVAVTGIVVRPGVYELRGRMSVQSLVEYAGGALRPRGYDLTVSRIGSDGRENFTRALGNAQMLVAGDAVQVIAGSGGGVEGRVSLRGSVVNPGVRALAAARTVRELLGEASELRSGTYMPMAVLVRRDPVTSADFFQPVNLIEALKDAPSVPTRNEDRLYVFSQADIQFLSRPAVRRILLGQANGVPQCRALQRLEALVNAGGQSQATTRAAGAETATEIANVGTGASDEQCPAVFEDNIDLLPVLIENSVGVGGAVRRPGSYPVATGTSAEVLVAVSGGLTAHASNIMLDVISSKARLSPISSVAISRDGKELAELTLLPGDNLRVNASQPQLELGSVLLSGEFQRPGLYAIRAGETLGQLITRAGGLTPLAYPYGAIFTRLSVKQAQQEGFRRTARELNSGLLFAATRRNGDGDSLAGLIPLITQLETVEAPGRMVIEADPRILAVRLDLDTVLESGDAIMIPKTPNYVLALGDISNPGALQFVSGKSSFDYLREAGGVQATADSSRAFLVLPNGTAQPIRASVWKRSNSLVPPGSTIIVPKNLDPFRPLDFARDLTTIVGQLATSLASIAILSRR